jgi:hypothetical protein
MDFQNIFGEDSDGILSRFSTVILFIFVYYSLSYYFLTNDDECMKKPHISKVAFLIFFHIVHIILLKILHDNEMVAYMWVAAMLPIFLYLIYTKYIESIKRKEERMMKEMYAQLQAKQGGADPEFIRNAVPQKPPGAPMRGQQFVGVAVNGNKHGDVIPHHQMQHNDPLPPSNPMPTYSAPPQIARQENMSNTFQQGAPQYDANSINNYRQHNTVSEPIQQMQQLDMQPIGGAAGSMGFDPYAGSFAAF